MEASQLWLAIQEIQKHTSVMNSELGKTMVDVAWLKQSWWELISWIKIIATGVIVGLVLSIWNLIIAKRNGKH